MRNYQFGQPPQALKRVKLDNIVLMPASALPFKAQYQTIANRIPTGGVLIVTPNPTPSHITSTAALLRRTGHAVKLIATVVSASPVR